MAEYKLEVLERVSGYKTVYYLVEAESFDDAIEEYHNGNAEWYDDDGFDEECTDDCDINEVTHTNCGEREGYCECSDEEDERPEVEPNPDAKRSGAGGVFQPSAFLRGDMVVAADDYTKNIVDNRLYSGSNDGTYIFEVEQIGNLDADNERCFIFNHPDGSRDSFYVNDECRFLSVRPGIGEVPDEVRQALEERETKKAAAILQLEEQKAVSDLLDVF